MNPATNPKQYDAILFAGVPTPGKLKWTTKPKRNHGWDKQEAKGSDGGGLVPNGKKISDFVIELFLWDAVQQERWAKFRPLLSKTIKDGDKTALDVYHPILEEVEIRSVVLNEETGVVPSEGTGGGATVELGFIEYRPKKKNTGGLNGSKNSTKAKDGKPEQSDGAKKLALAREYRAKQTEAIQKGNLKEASGWQDKIQAL